jgi:hypothetical protein
LFFWSYIAAAADLWSGWQLESGIGVWCSESLASQNPFGTIWSTTLENRNFPFWHFEGSDIRVFSFLWFQIFIRVWFLGIIFVCAQMRSRFFWEVWHLLIQNFMKFCKPKKKEGLEGDNFLWFFFWAWYSCEMHSEFDHDNIHSCEMEMRNAGGESSFIWM